MLRRKKNYANDQSISKNGKKTSGKPHEISCAAAGSAKEGSVPAGAYHDAEETEFSVA
jgi:hypothetical protein